MKNSADRIQFITDYIFSYESKIKELNKQKSIIITIAITIVKI